MTFGKFSESDAVGDAAVSLKAQSINLFAVATGEDQDVDTLVKIVSPPAENNVFMATSSGELQPLLRALTDTVCKGGMEGEQVSFWSFFFFKENSKNFWYSAH